MHSTLLFVIFIPLVITGPLEVNNQRSKCQFSRQIFPGLSHINISDSSGKRCWGEVQLPVCKGFCKTSESGTYTFPSRVQNSSVCILIQTGFEEIVLTCDDGAEESIRTLRLPKGDRCGCRRLPLD